MILLTRTALLTLCLCGCATSQGTFVPMGPPHSARAENAEVEVFQSRLPTKPFVRVAQLEAHLEKTHFIHSTYREAEELLKQQARRAGADAIIEIKELRSQVGETPVYHVSGVGIAYR